MAKRYIFLLLALYLWATLIPPRASGISVSKNTIEKFTRTHRALAGSEEPPAGGLVAEVIFSNRQVLDWMANFLDIWEVDHSRNRLIAFLTPADQTRLRERGVIFQVDHNRSEALSKSLHPLIGQTGGIPGYPCYRTIDEIYAQFATLADAYPTLARWIDIGDSWEKTQAEGAPGDDLFALVIGDQGVSESKAALVILAAVHARELATAETAARFAEFLLSQYVNNADIFSLLKHTEVHIIPFGNPDGRRLAENGASWWRKNTDNDDGCAQSSLWGVDLNRNSSYPWGLAGASADACDETFRGPFAASEPETQAIEAYLRKVFADRRGPEMDDLADEDTPGIFLTLHSYGNQVLWPWGWTAGATPNAAGLETLGQRMAYYTGYWAGQSYQLYLTSGAVDDWAYAELGVPSYTIEIGPGPFFQDCYTFENGLYPNLQQALLYALKTARLPYQLPSGPETIGIVLTPAEAAPGVPVKISASAVDSRFHSFMPVQPISASHYSINSFPWMDNSIPAELNAGDGAWGSSEENVVGRLETQSLTYGRHIIVIESQDASGSWGPPAAAFLTIAAPSYRFNTPTSVPPGLAIPGSVADHKVAITNTGNITHTLGIVVIGSTWSTSITSPTLTLPAGEIAALKAQVSVPFSASIGASTYSILQIRSMNAPDQVQQVILETRVQPEYTFSVSSKDQLLRSWPGKTITHTISITNTGNISDSYRIFLDKARWQTSVLTVTPLLPPRASIQMLASVQIPACLSGLLEDIAHLTIQSQGDESLIAKLVLHTLAGGDTYLPALLNRAPPIPVDPFYWREIPPR